MDLGACLPSEDTGKDQAPQTGTTIVAVSFAGGVCIGADGRVSTGTYVSNRASNKIQQLTDNAFLLRSGSAADTQAVGDYVRYFADQLSAELGKAPSVATVAKLVATMNYQNKEMLVGAMIVAGYDEQLGGQVYGCPIGGTLVREQWAVDGSGSTYIWAALDDGFREGMTREEAEQLVIEVLSLAMTRDASSGGVIRLVSLDKGGVARRYVGGEEVPTWFEDLPAPGAAAAAMAVG